MITVDDVILAASGTATVAAVAFGLSKLRSRLSVYLGERDSADRSSAGDCGPYRSAPSFVDNAPLAEEPVVEVPFATKSNYDMLCKHIRSECQNDQPNAKYSSFLEDLVKIDESDGDIGKLYGAYLAREATAELRDACTLSLRGATLLDSEIYEYAVAEARIRAHMLGLAVDWEKIGVRLFLNRIDRRADGNIEVRCKLVVPTRQAVPVMFDINGRWNALIGFRQFS